ncbi:Mu prophage protein [Escherichia coli]|nr:Mu prophage protein [Escherichia coli]
MLCQALRLIHNGWTLLASLARRLLNAFVRSTAAPESPLRVAKTPWKSPKNNWRSFVPTACCLWYLHRQQKRSLRLGGLDVLGVGDLNTRIRATVAGLDKANPEHFTAGGEPKVKAVSAALGEPVSGAQIKAALAEVDA